MRLARVHQWSKGAFVLVGPAFALASGTTIDPVPVLWALLAMCLASSGCYVFNDLADVERDRTHPRKCKRPIASGAISESSARVFGIVLLIGAIGAAMMVGGVGRWWVLGIAAANINP